MGVLQWRDGGYTVVIQWRDSGVSGVPAHNSSGDRTGASSDGGGGSHTPYIR
jgi:hypothetical protein